MVQTDKVFFSFFLRKLTVIPHNVCSGTVLSLSFFLLLSYTTHLSFFCCCYKCQGIWALDRRIVCTKEGNIFFCHCYWLTRDLPSKMFVCVFFFCSLLPFIRSTNLSLIVMYLFTIQCANIYSEQMDVTLFSHSNHFRGRKQKKTFSTYSIVDAIYDTR